MRILTLCGALLMVAGCASGGGATQELLQSYGLESPVGMVADTEYRIGASDKLSVSVFQVPALTFEEIVVDAGGNLQFPLVGSIKAAGMTAAELSDELRTRLSQQYLRNPMVNVTVAEAASQKVTVDGAVTQAGVFEMRGRTTLLQAIAMARGTSASARLNNVAVFRTVEGRRMAAVFDLTAIRRGEAADPLLLGDDVVIVDTSKLSQNLQLALQALPSLAVFGYFQ